MILPYDASKEERDRIVKERQAKTAAAFDRMREMIDEQTATMNMSTVSEKVRRQQLEEIRNELQKSLGTFYSDLETGLKSDMESIGQSVLNESKGFYEALNMPIAMSITSFPVEVMTNIVNGSVYEEKWYLSQALWGDYTDKLDDINEVITQGIGLNLSTYEIAKNLEKYVDPSARKEWEWSKVYPGTAKTVDYNAQRLARTLINHAYQQNVVQQAKANPFSKGVKWLASGVERRMCDICAERDGKVYPADDVPLDHPNGMCTFEVVTEDLMTISNTLADFVNGQPTDYDDKLYAWYNDRAVTPEQKPVDVSGLINYILHSDFAKNVPAEYRAAFEESIRNMPANYVRLVRDTFERVDISWIAESETSFCSGDYISLYYKKFGENRDTEDVLRTFWHEYGHFVDHLMKDTPYVYTEADSRGRSYDISGIKYLARKDNQYSEAAIKDLNLFLQRYGLSDKYHFAMGESTHWLYDSNGNSVDIMNMDFETNKAFSDALSDWMKKQSGYEKAVNYLYDQGYPKEVRYSDYFVQYTTPKRGTIKTKEKYKGAEVAYVEANMARHDLIDKFTSTHDMEKLYAEQRRLYDLAEKREALLGAVTDTFDESAWGSFASVIVGGHDMKYYFGHGEATEGVANIFSAEVLDDEVIKEGFRDLCPNVYGLIGGIIKDGAK